MRRSMATVAGRGTLRWDGNRVVTSWACDGQRAPRMSHITVTVPGMFARPLPRTSSALSASPHQTGTWRLPSPWPSWPARSTRRIRSGYPAGERPVPAVVRRFEEHRLPALVVAAVACDPDVSHAAAARGGFPGWLAEARCPAHLCLAGPQQVTERTGFRLILEQRNGYLNDHGPAGGHESMII